MDLLRAKTDCHGGADGLALGGRGGGGKTRPAMGGTDGPALGAGGHSMDLHWGGKRWNAMGGTDGPELEGTDRFLSPPS